MAVSVGPVWTPLFPILGRLVLEKGSVGQHAEATAREYGVPVAIQVKDACHLIVEGSWISVDGESGSVELVDWQGSYGCILLRGIIHPRLRRADT